MTIQELDKHLFEEAEKILNGLHDGNLRHENIKLLADIAAIQLWLWQPAVYTYFGSDLTKDVTSGSFIQDTKHNPY